MKLVELLTAVEEQGGGFKDPHACKSLPAAVQDTKISAICCRSQQVIPGSLFVAIKGFATDGHRFIAQAVEQGACAVICEQPSDVDALVLPVKDSRKALAALAAAYYGHPSADMTVIGITGTNGKTTTSYLIESVLQAAGIPVGVIGTINYRYGGKVFNNPVTTPESIDLQRIMSDMRTAGASHVVMEVSSHALDLHRVLGCRFDVGVFTNFSQDHLDYHQDMSAYWACKKKLFSQYLPASAPVKKPCAVINSQDPKARELIDCLQIPYLTGGQNRKDHVRVVSTRVDLTGIAARIATPRGEVFIQSPLVGRHNLENILSAVATAIALGIPLATIASGIQALPSVPGRLEMIPNQRRRFVYVDYAHTPDALENALLALRSMTADRIICVFGCGGDRDRNKRPQMGSIAGRICDLTVVTSDNPRTEPPEQIIAEIVAGLQQSPCVLFDRTELNQGFREKGYVVDADRRSAINLSIQVSRPGDTILIAGKGHEPYQVIGTRKFDFDDRQVALAALRRLRQRKIERNSSERFKNQNSVEFILF
jgi:UDP-N-acetylmuramyl-tripeptide synthetase